MFIGFIIGVTIGILVGAIIAAMLASAKRVDMDARLMLYEMEERRRKARNSEDMGELFMLRNSNE